MKRTLLNLVQGILSKSDGDNVNSISDTIEATQIANLIGDVYQDMVVEMDLPHNNELITLTTAASPAQPTHMLIPERTSKIHWINYAKELERGYTGQPLDVDGITTFFNAVGDSSDPDIDLVTMNGALTSGGIASFSGPAYVTISQVGSGASPGTFIITGNYFGESVVESVIFASGSGSYVATSVNQFTGIASIQWVSDLSPSFYVSTQVGVSPGDDVAAVVQYVRIPWVSVEEFTNRTNARPSGEETVQVVSHGPNDILLNIYTDKFPSFWTSPDDEYLVFDSWDSTVESTLISNKFQVWAETEPLVTLTDGFIFDLPANLFPLLYAKAFAEYKATLDQEPNPKAEQTERRLRVRAQRNKWREQRILRTGINFGRIGGDGYRTRSGD